MSRWNGRKPPLHLVAIQPEVTGSGSSEWINQADLSVPAAAKVLSHAQLLEKRFAARGAGRRVVQCHGCFDIVHPGHLRHLRHARAQGEVLLVSITGDSMIDKGTGRPLIPQELRAENLAALDCVDWVYIEARPTAAEWKRLLAADLQDWDFRKSAATRDYLRQQYELTRTLLVELGMAK